MTAAGVQNLEPAAYLPPPPTASADSKSASAENARGGQSDFQTELDLQKADSQDNKPVRPPKTGSGKSAKKKDAAAESQNAEIPAPVQVQVAEPQKQILPLVLALPAADDENATAAKPAKTGDPVQIGDSPRPVDPLQMNETSQEPAQPVGQKPHSSIAGIARRADVKQSMRMGQPTERLSIEVPSAKKDSSEEPDAPKSQILPLVGGIPVLEDKIKAAEQVIKAAKPAVSAETLPASKIELDLPPAAPEAAAAAIQEAQDSAPSSPSALAFAARLVAASQKEESPVAASPAQPLGAPNAQQPADKIPVRYAPTAQILPNTGADINIKGPRKNANSLVDSSAWTEARTIAKTGVRADVRTDVRTDMVIPRMETASHAAPNSAPAAPQAAATPAHIERILDVPAPEPLAAPRTSTHDIRVRVPDNNGGTTQVRFVESGGEVKVSVRTADSGLAQNLRTHLNDLTQRLADGGIPAEFWKPSPSASSSQNDPHQPDREGRGSSGQESGGRNGQQDREQNRPAWLEEMEASLHGEK